MDQTTESNTAFLRAAPVSDAGRLRVIDMLRGVALLGILLMNIPGFAMSEYFSEAFRSNPANPNFWALAVVTIFFEGKMRALFGMVFGAGVLLFALKKKQTGRPVHGLFYRRMFWLVIFGALHAHLLLWFGDILFLYGICGMLVYLFRNAKPVYLVMFVPVVALLDFGAGTVFYRNIRSARLAYVEAAQAQGKGQALSEGQAKALADWREIEKTLIPNRQDVEENTRKMKSGYGVVASHVRPLALKFETTLLPFTAFDSLALMLLGVGLFKWGFLTGSWSRESYRKIALIGYGIGLPLVIYSYYYNVANFPTVEAGLRHMEAVPVNWIALIYPFQRILLILAHISSLILIYQLPVLQHVFRRLEAVGQMAFTNYILHTVICSLVFFGYGLNMFAELQYYQILMIAAAIWLLQLVISPLWLRAFHFGPLEWLWRTLTYLRIPPMMRKHDSRVPAFAKVE